MTSTPLRPFARRLWTETKAAALAALWISLLAFPLMILKINNLTGALDPQWSRLPKLAVAVFLGAYLWRFLLRRRSFSAVSKVVAEAGGPPPAGPRPTWVDLIMKTRRRKPLLGLVLAALLVLPFFASPYVVNVMITALIYVTLGLGLNIVVGVSGLLNLGYVAFYAMGAYVYALLGHYFGLGFWLCLPLGALSATVMGLLLGLPIIRLNGDYLAIVTLSFGEIMRLVLTNLGVTRGPRGIPNIKPPGFFGVDLNGAPKAFLMRTVDLSPAMDLNKILIYLIILALVALTVVCVFRLENSRLGRACLALREDEVACQAMGVNRTRAKLTAFALGSTWAGLAGVVFASQITFINPSSFTFMQSVMILSIVVLGGMGSIPGVIIGAVVLILLPEQLRFFSNYRMLIFGALMVMMMIFRPGGLIQSAREVYRHQPAGGGSNDGSSRAADGDTGHRPEKQAERRPAHA
ncbi:MAG: high-affinity branched-chain amino acid ABC transporter permease LivM [Deltaproteobacteria bacterium]|jgi:branched-chain amino acid transport system permease protein|nr:high-affinity branched-chain amino acid ABC transporter permease LivM [Deltaproteobacteria bacterium]